MFHGVLPPEQLTFVFSSVVYASTIEPSAANLIAPTPPTSGTSLLHE